MKLPLTFVALCALVYSSALTSGAPARAGQATSTAGTTTPQGAEAAPLNGYTTDYATSWWDPRPYPGRGGRGRGGRGRGPWRGGGRDGDRDDDDDRDGGRRGGRRGGGGGWNSQDQPQDAAQEQESSSQVDGHSTKGSSNTDTFLRGGSGMKVNAGMDGANANAPLAPRHTETAATWGPPFYGRPPYGYGGPWGRPPYGGPYPYPYGPGYGGWKGQGQGQGQGAGAGKQPQTQTNLSANSGGDEEVTTTSTVNGRDGTTTTPGSSDRPEGRPYSSGPYRKLKRQDANDDGDGDDAGEDFSTTMEPRGEEYQAGDQSHIIKPRMEEDQDTAQGHIIKPRREEHFDAAQGGHIIKPRAGDETTAKQGHMIHKPRDVESTDSQGHIIRPRRDDSASACAGHVIKHRDGDEGESDSSEMTARTHETVSEHMALAHAYAHQHGFEADEHDERVDASSHSHDLPKGYVKGDDKE